MYSVLPLGLIVVRDIVPLTPLIVGVMRLLVYSTVEATLAADAPLPALATFIYGVGWLAWVSLMCSCYVSLILSHMGTFWCRVLRTNGACGPNIGDATMTLVEL